MSTKHWPDWMEETIWAKSAEKGADGKPESLAQHTWDVLSRLSDFARLRRYLPQQLGAPRLWHILYWAAFLHDYGKAAGGFQSRLRKGPSWPHRHEVLSLAFVNWIVGGFAPQEYLWLVAAIVSHHRDASDISSLYPSTYEDDKEQLKELVAELDDKSINDLWRWLSECGNAWIDELGLADFGVCRIQVVDQNEGVERIKQQGANEVFRWLKAYRHFVRQLHSNGDNALITATIALRGHLINADHSASAHAPSLPQLSFNADTVLHSRQLTWDGLFGHQRDSGTTAGSALLTAPTGSGKTEAALLWAAQQAKIDGGVPRIFYTLPYQASMNAMMLRLQETFGKDNNVGLQHGRSLLALYRFLLEREEYAGHSAAREARWTRNLANLNYPPVRVFSPYQMLKGMYRLKGYEALLSDYHNALFIFDEIHAYEVKRLALILQTMRYLKEHYRARFFIMSATFPTLIKEWINEALDYPAVVSADGKLFDEFTRHRLFLQHGDLISDQGLGQISADAIAGKSVLVVCNTVDRAQTVFDELDGQLSAQGVHVELLHGRFNMRDRLTKEGIVRDATGSKSENRRAIVLVATQVVEVSLDIDLDTIYTDPAPLEALVQRFGRINRRRLNKNLALVHVFDSPNDGQGIYNPALIQGTLKVLEREHGNPLNEAMVGDWLDEIYDGDVATQWTEEYVTAAREFDAICIQTLRAFDADEALEDDFYKAFDGLEVLPYDFYDEYQQLKVDEPIRAGELLVPIRLGRFHALKNQGRVLAREKGEPHVIRAQYTSEKGLVFDE
ncbi:CRISPR-associated helicase Cas3' [bacterium]|nr:CRISPR-associated helicase Cas3' [bacterium]